MNLFTVVSQEKHFYILFFALVACGRVLRGLLVGLRPCQKYNRQIDRWTLGRAHWFAPWGGLIGERIYSQLCPKKSIYTMYTSFFALVAFERVFIARPPWGLRPCQKYKRPMDIGQTGLLIASNLSWFDK